ncbi:hypothetical protein L332_08100 [Agrococcus pavilionensis RW1]|uniref:Uncharacterized protein n=1 Tax=Agrococcus pavilionensis RW1 TaxID=1330458 RepID=U1LPR2_9MICO|nr:hypothetical protein [Agrococcus pavilionensis]ERG64409.1 hypothetical protein L332_08100 [Agrococcus pavilionensis RW1]
MLDLAGEAAGEHDASASEAADEQPVEHLEGRVACEVLRFVSDEARA